MPQAISVWCRELGHEVYYATYYGQQEPASLLPQDLDFIFISCTTRASALAYALSKLYAKRGTITVIGGAHARSFPADCLRFFDLAVKGCDKRVIQEILSYAFDRHTIINCDRPLTHIPSVEQRMPEISQSMFSRRRSFFSGVVPLLSSMGCPNRCDFCVDWDSTYSFIPQEKLEADLKYISANLPDAFVAFHDPNFGVKIDQVLESMDHIDPPFRNKYYIESSLSLLNLGRLQSLKKTNCLYVEIGIESWADYSNKTTLKTLTGRDKYESVVSQFSNVQKFIPGIQANFIFGTDLDQGDEPVELMREFISRFANVWPNINIPVPFGYTPLYDQYLKEKRLLTSMPFSFYDSPYLVFILKNYDPIEYYSRLIAIYNTAMSQSMLIRRWLAKAPLILKIIYTLTTFYMRTELSSFHLMRKMLRLDEQFKAFHEGRSVILPEFYHSQYEQRLSHYAHLISREERLPKHAGSIPYSTVTA